MTLTQKAINNLSKKLVTKMVDKEPREWPPTCILLSYQPVRPLAKVEAPSTHEGHLAQHSEK